VSDAGLNVSLVVASTVLGGGVAGAVLPLVLHAAADRRARLMRNAVLRMSMVGCCRRRDLPVN
jgi:hypothetical protein